MPNKVSREDWIKSSVRGNYDKIWKLFKEIPCTVCGATSKTMSMSEGNKITLYCYLPPIHDDPYEDMGGTCDKCVTKRDLLNKCYERTKNILGKKYRYA